VTGAASEIGRQVAPRLRDLGVSLVLADLNSDGLDAVMTELANVHCVDASAMIGDRTDESVIHRTMTESIAAFGGTYGVVLNAGIAGTGPVDLSSAD